MTAGQNTFLAVSDVFFSFLCVIFLLFRQKEEKWLKKCVIAALMLKGVISSALNYKCLVFKLCPKSGFKITLSDTFLEWQPCHSYAETFLFTKINIPLLYILT